MPTQAENLDYETIVESALAAVMAAAFPDTQILTPLVMITEAPELRTPRITLSYTCTGSNPNFQNDLPDGEPYDSHKYGTITLSASVQRNNTEQSLGALRGGIRAALLTGVVMAPYQVVTLRETASSMSAGAGNDEIITTLTYALEFFIPPGALTG